MALARQALVLAVVSQLGALRARLPRATEDAVRLLDGLFDAAAADLGGVRLELDVRGALFGFPTVLAALRWAAAVQRAALDAPWPAVLLKHPEATEQQASGHLNFRGLRLAMAVHLDEPDGISAQHLGRLLDITAGGRILIGAEAARAVDPLALAPDRVAVAGTARLDGLRGDRTVYELVLDGLDRGYGRPVPAPRGRYEGRAFFGRTGDLAALDELTGLGIRVVCVDGEQGVGKSRLLARFARNRVQQGAPVVCFDLATASGPWDVLRALASALDVPLREERGERDAIDRIATAVLATPGITVVVDHAENARETLRSIVRRAPGSHWVIGGCARLGVAAEVTYALEPLPLDDSRNADAVRLFDDRARLARSDFALGTGGEVHAIVAELHGNPLAIELAAALVTELRPLTVFDRLTARRGEPLRVLPLVLDCVLTEPQRALLADLGVLPGLFDREVVQALGGPDARADLQRLADLGLVQRVEELGSPGLRRMRVHARVRARLAEVRPPRESALPALAAWLADRCDRWSAQLTGPRADLALARLELEQPLIDVITERLLAQSRVGPVELGWIARLAHARVEIARRRGPTGPLADTLQKALTAVAMCFDVEPLVAVRLLRARGVLFERLGEYEKAIGDLGRAMSLAERRKEAAEVARIRMHTGRARLGQGRLDEAIAVLRAAIAEFDALDAPVDAARARSTLGAALSARGLLDDAATELVRAHQVLDAHGAPRARGEVIERLALVRRRQRDIDGAQGHYREALALWQHLGERDREAYAHFQLATLLQARGQLESAAEHLACADQLAHRCGDNARRGLILTQLGLIWLEQGQRDLAHRTLIQAVSASRAGGDRAGQGAAKGFLGLLHHLAGRLDEARDGYRAAIRDLESGGERRFGPLFHGCLGAAEAELGNLEDARILVDLARMQGSEGDPALATSAGLFVRSVDLARAEVADAAGDAATARDLRAGVRAALADLEGADENAVLRVARKHLEGLSGSIG